MNQYNLRYKNQFSKLSESGDDDILKNKSSNNKNHIKSNKRIRSKVIRSKYG